MILDGKLPSPGCQAMLLRLQQALQALNTYKKDAFKGFIPVIQRNIRNPIVLCRAYNNKI
jgi:hypothetical protein